MTETASEILAGFAVELRREDLPDAVVAIVKRHLLDTVGVALAAASMEFAESVVRGARELSGEGDAVIIGRRDVEKKFIANATRSVSPAAAAAVQQRIAELDDAADLLAALRAE